MVRASSVASSPNAMLAVTPNGRLHFQRRLMAGASSYTTPKALSGMGTWLRLTREGNEVRAYASLDGLNWTYLASEIFEHGNFASVGLAVTSHDKTKVNTAFFSDVHVSTAITTETWRSQDIGAISQMGTATRVSDTAFSVTGSGSDIWGGNDAFHFVSLPVDGDVELSARVVSQANTHPWAKAGVMIRDSDQPNARHAFMVLTPGAGVAFQRRPETGAVSVSTGVSGITGPNWVKLTKVGNILTGSVSTDGLEWQIVGATQIEFGPALVAGLAVTSHDNTKIGRAEFDQIALRVTPPETPYEAWVRKNELSGADAMLSADPDRDGFTNQEEFTNGFDPRDGRPESELARLFERLDSVREEQWPAIVKLNLAAHMRKRHAQQAPFTIDGHPDVDPQFMTGFLAARKVQQVAQGVGLRARLLAQFDANEDGLLSRAEIEPLIAEIRPWAHLEFDNPRRNFERWKFGLRHCDLDGDRLLFGHEILYESALVGAGNPRYESRSPESIMPFPIPD